MIQMTTLAPHQGGGAALNPVKRIVASMPSDELFVFA